MFAHALTALFWLATLLLLAGLAARARLWSVGRRAEVDWWALAAIPKRYVVDLHHVVAREPFIARTHIATAGGAVAAIALVGLNYGLALYRPALDRLIAACAALMLGGVLFVWLRRRHALARLSGGAWSRLPYTLACVALGLIVISLLRAPRAGSAVSLLALLAVAIGAAELVLGIGAGGPMKHAVAGLLHLAFHPRRERFRGACSSALQPIELAQPRRAACFGVERASDFQWNQLLSFDACVQCGKCEAACPAFAAEQPLNPKKLIQDLVLSFAGGDDAGYAGSPTPGLNLGAHRGAAEQPIVSELIDAQTLWSCTTCRACVYECPMLIEHVDAVIDLRRHQTLSLGAVPPQAAIALQNLRETETLGGFARASRFHWAADLQLRTLLPQDSAEFLLIAGEGAFDLRYQRSLRALVQLLQRASVDFAILGDAERDCGDTARRLGDEATFCELAHRNIALLSGLHFQRILTADPHVLHCLRNEYPAFGGHYEVVHHTTLLAQLLEQGRLRAQPNASAARVTYHDPCYLARYNNEIAAPRQLLAGLGIEVQEMQRAGLRSRCCGGGGGAPLTDVPGKRRIPDMRMQDAAAIGAEIVAVACPGCTTMLEGVLAPRPQVLDVAELMLAAQSAR